MQINTNRTYRTYVAAHPSSTRNASAREMPQSVTHSNMATHDLATQVNSVEHTSAHDEPWLVDCLSAGRSLQHVPTDQSMQMFHTVGSTTPEMYIPNEEQELVMSDLKDTKLRGKVFKSNYFKHGLVSPKAPVRDSSM
jgi:hypothetical protein